MDRIVNLLIYKYRSLVLKEWDIEQQQEALNRGIRGLSKEQFMEYAERTQEIDHAMDEMQQNILAADWAYSTAKAKLHQAVNAVGFDREKVIKS